MSTHRARALRSLNASLRPPDDSAPRSSAATMLRMGETLRRLIRSLALALGTVLAAALWLAARDDAPPQGVTLQAAQMRQAGGVWQAMDLAVLSRWSGPLELQWTLGLAQAEPSLGLRVAIRGAGELRCNGQPLLLNGVAGATAADEAPGLVDRWLALPPLPAGTHTLTWLGSSHFVPAQGLRLTEARLEPMAVEALSRARHARWLVVAMAWGGLALTWLYFLRLEWSRGAGTQGVAVPAAFGASQAGPVRAHRILVAVGAVGLLLPLVESARDLWGYPYTWHLARLRTVLLCTMLAAWLLPLWALQVLRSPRHLGRWAVVWGAFLVLLALVAVDSQGYDAAAWLLHFSGLMACGALLFTVPRPPHVAMPPNHDDIPPPPAPSLAPLRALVAVALVLMLMQPGAFIDGLYTITLAALMVAAMLHHARVQQDRAQHESALRQRLASRLLRASMQPHGLMNTLAVLQELIEQRSAQASLLVERLADQFSLLRELSKRERVGLREELELVRTQLDLVGMARSLPVRLAVNGPVDGVNLPPGVLHTLVENAITHGGIKATAPAFALHIDEAPAGRWRLRLTSPRGAGREGGSGQGQRFVRESLTGAFGDDWSYEAGPADAAVWVDTLSFPRT
jgi:hypothetical protein